LADVRKWLSEIAWDAMEDPDSSYTSDRQLALTGAAAHELANAGHRRILAG
jgi:hypothetical protein